MWVEFEAILNSVSVLYPVDTDIHYRVTGRLCLFNQTPSALAAPKINEHFSKIPSIKFTRLISMIMNYFDTIALLSLLIKYMIHDISSG